MNLAYHPIPPDGTNFFLRSHWHDASDGQSTVSSPSYFRDLPVSDWTGKVQLDPLAKDTATGGFADVYKGYVFEPQTKERTTVAVKRLHLDVSDEKLAKDVATEIKTWFEFKHPNILPLLGYAMKGSYPSFVSPWMEHGSLHALMDSLCRSESITMILELASGLAYIHGRGAIHLDIKTKNVLVSPEKRALLTDFGVSRMETLSTGRTNRNGNVGGTIRWQAVEFFKIIDEGDSSQEYTFGDRRLGVWNDCLCERLAKYKVELLARSAPYAQIKNDTQVIFSIAQGRLPKKPDFSENPIDARIEEFMWLLCKDCWQTDPKSRPSMSDLERRIRGEVTKY